MILLLLNQPPPNILNITHNLKWNQHCDNICSKANSTLGLLRRVLSDVKSKAYTTLVCSQLEYTCSVWNLYTKRNIHQIKLVQQRAARFVFRDYSNFSHVTPMLKHLCWVTLLNNADLCTNYQCLIKSN